MRLNEFSWAPFHLMASYWDFWGGSLAVRGYELSPEVSPNPTEGRLRPQTSIAFETQAAVPV
jgi:hypothetical protein